MAETETETETLFDVDLAYSFASERTISCIMCTAADLALLLQ